MLKVSDSSVEKWIDLRDQNGDRIEGAELPPMDCFVEVLFFDGQRRAARRIIGFEPGTGWIWESDMGWLVAGHPLLVAWMPIDE